MIACPNCESRLLRPACTPNHINKEIQLRERFVRRRLDHAPESAERMDLTEFMHGGTARFLECAVCGLAVRDEDSSAHYQDDVYDLDLMAQLYPRYLSAFLRKESAYRGLLDPGAEVIELGSHTGAFLEAAEQWNWRPTGLDIGEYTSAFAKRRGLRVQRRTIQNARLQNHAADAVFIWNCFEQLPDAPSTLHNAHRLLKRGGLIVIRTPNWEHYARFPRTRRQMKSLALNNLLGFPYLAGYTPRTLAAALEENGFDVVVGLDATLITPPFPALNRALEREIAAAYRPYADQHVKNPLDLTGPWIELVARAKTL